MKKFLFFLLICVFLFSGCTIQKNGDDLSGFIFKMNEKNESYNLTAEGFLYSEENNVFYKFFLIDESEIMLTFTDDDKGRLTKMNIVSEKEFYNSENIINFLNNALFSFINNDTITNEIIEDIDFYNTIKTDTKETIEAKNGNIKLLLDVTEIGTVITVYKDI